MEIGVVGVKLIVWQKFLRSNRFYRCEKGSFVFCKSAAQVQIPLYQLAVHKCIYIKSIPTIKPLFTMHYLPLSIFKYDVEVLLVKVIFLSDNIYHMSIKDRGKQIMHDKRTNFTIQPETCALR